ncbi:MAG: tetratricopeptide repeat protein [Cystobacterineae bacterium]|nr:tetratricopeptide repeat protein [Cystobacterineae bacterium]
MKTLTCPSCSANLLAAPNPIGADIPCPRCNQMLPRNAVDSPPKENAETTKTEKAETGLPQGKPSVNLVYELDIEEETPPRAQTKPRQTPAPEHSTSSFPAETEDSSQNPFEKYAPSIQPFVQQLATTRTPPVGFKTLPMLPPLPSVDTPLPRASDRRATELMERPLGPPPRPLGLKPSSFASYATTENGFDTTPISTLSPFASPPPLPVLNPSLPPEVLKSAALPTTPQPLLHAAATPKPKTSRFKLAAMSLGLCLLASSLAVYFVYPSFLFPASPKHSPAQVLPPLPSLGEMQTKLQEGTWQALSEISARPDTLSQGNLEQALLWCRSVFSLALLGDKPAGLEEALSFMSQLPPKATHASELPKTKAAYALLSKTPEARDQAIEILTALPQKDGESTWLLAWAYFKQDKFQKAVQLLEADSKIFEPRRQKALGDMALAMGEPISAIAHYKKAHAHPLSQAEMDVAIAKAWLEANRPRETLEQLKAWAKAPAEASLAKNAWALTAHAQLELGLYAEAALTLEKLKTDNPLYAELMAKLFVAKKEPQKAAALLKEELEKNPDELRLAKPYVQALLLDGKPLKAENFARQLLQENPENVRVRLFCATVFQQLGQMESALLMVEKALSMEPQNVDAKLQWAAIQQKWGQFSTAQNFLEQAIAEFSKTAPTGGAEAAALWTALGGVLEQTLNLPKAKEAYAQALLKQPHQLEALTGLGRMALNEGNMTELWQYVEKIQALNPRSPEGVWLWANLLWAEAKKEEALEKLEWALSKDSSQVDFWLSKAQMTLEDKRLNSADEALAHARQLNPSLTTVNHLSGLLFEAQGDFNKAQVYFQKAAETDRKNPSHLLAQSRVLMSARHFQEAAEILGRVMAEYPTNTEAPLLLGRYYQERYRFKTALPLFEKALAIEPNNTEALRGTADCLLELTRWEQATAMLQRLLKQTPEDVQVVIRLGRASFESGHYAQAIQWYQKSLEQLPDNPSVLLNLGWAFKELGRNQDAIWAFQNYLKLESWEPNKKMLEDEIGFLSQR